MSWSRDWFYNSTIQGLLHHAVDTLAAILVFTFIGQVLKWTLSDPTTVWFIENTESIVIDGLLVIFGLRLLIIPVKELWHQIRGGWNDTRVLAV
jgi:hypothetical protein